MVEMVSVICPVYNVAKYLNSCIESLVNQTYRNIEIILIDDGSSDESPKICDEWDLKDKRIKVIHNTRGGVSSARNTGVKNSKGEFIFFVDADDVLELNAIEVLLKYHDKNKDTIVVLNYDRFTDFHKNSVKKCRYDLTKNYMKPTIKDFVSVRRGCYVWEMLVSRALIVEKNIMFNEELHNLEDVAWTGVTICYLKRMIFVKDILYHYRRNPTSITSNCVNYEWQAKCWLCAKKAIDRYFDKKVCTREERKNVCLVDRYCKNNFHAECFAGHLIYGQMKKLCKAAEIPCSILWWYTVNS